MTHEDLLELGFELLGEEEQDPFYKIVFKPPFSFNIQYLSGALLKEGRFWLYGNNSIYTHKEDLKKVIDTFNK